jgi:hypothetical protein
MLSGITDCNYAIKRVAHKFAHDAALYAWRKRFYWNGMSGYNARNFATFAYALPQDGR